MKTFITMITLIFALFSITPDAEARKFGGKRSLGKSHNTTQQKQTTEQKSTNTSQKSSKKGLMGGMLGGLLAGGLIATMIGGDAFEGFQMMDFLIIAGIAFILFKLFKGMNQAKAQAQRPAYAASQAHFRQQSQPEQSFNSAGGFAGTSTDTATEQVPFNLPSGFDLSAFLEGSRGHYKTLQQAWNDNNLAEIQEYVSNELYNELSKDRRELTNEPNNEVMFLDAELVRAQTSTELAEVSVKFSGRYRDVNEEIEEDIKEVWHLERQLNADSAPWLIVGIEQ